MKAAYISFPDMPSFSFSFNIAISSITLSENIIMRGKEEDVRGVEPVLRRLYFLFKFLLRQCTLGVQIKGVVQIRELFGKLLTSS